jgi:hypothetical protein
MAKKDVTSDFDEKEKMQLVIAQYNSLRSEIIKRGEFRYQFLSLTLVIAGTILTFGLQPTAPPNVLFVFPIIACFLAGVWAHNIIIQRLISKFIKEKIEAHFGGWGWETSVEKQLFTSPCLSGIIASSGIFIGTSIIALLLGILNLKSTFSIIDIVLIITDGIAICVMFIMIRSTTRE